MTPRAQPSGPSSVARHSSVNVTREKSTFMYFLAYSILLVLCLQLRGRFLGALLTLATSRNALQRVARHILGIIQALNICMLVANGVLTTWRWICQSWRSVSFLNFVRLYTFLTSMMT